MNLKLVALATVAMLASGCAVKGPVKPPAEPDVHSPIASVGASGAAPSATQSGSGAAPAGRTRAEVHAEAVEFVKNYKPTMQADREYFAPRPLPRQ